MSVEYKTTFASIDNYNKGGVQMIAGNIKDYVFSNVYEVASFPTFHSFLRTPSHSSLAACLCSFLSFRR